jgi:hypothetical protein
LAVSRELAANGITVRPELSATQTASQQQLPVNNNCQSTTTASQQQLLFNNNCQSTTTASQQQLPVNNNCQSTTTAIQQQLLFNNKWRVGEWMDEDGIGLVMVAAGWGVASAACRVTGGYRCGRRRMRLP